MNKQLTKDFYSSPLVKVKELQARQMLCGSPTSAEKYGSDLGEGGEDLNF